MKKILLFLMSFFICFFNIYSVQAESFTGKNKFNINAIKSMSGASLQGSTIATNCYTAVIQHTLRELAPDLKAGQVYTLSLESTSSQKYIYLLGSGKVWFSGSSYYITEADLDNYIAVYGHDDYQNPVCEGEIYYISNIQIEQGLVATDYEDYYVYNTFPSGYQKTNISSVSMRYLEGNYIGDNNYLSSSIALGNYTTISRTRPFKDYYKDIYVNFSGEFKSGYEYTINLNFDVDFMSSYYLDVASFYVKTGSSYDKSQVKLTDSHLSKISESNNGVTSSYQLSYTFVATENFSTGRVGVTFNVEDLLKNTTPIGGEGWSSASSSISIASKVRFKYFSSYYKMNTDDILIDQTNEVKGIGATVKKIFNTIVNLPKNIASSIGGFFVQLGDRISSLFDIFKDDDTSGSQDTANSFFDNFQDNDHGLSSIITAPLNAIKNVQNAQCEPLKLKVPFVENQELTLPCMTQIYKQHFPDFLNIWQIITFGIVSYHVCVNLYATIKAMKDPKNDSIEVMEL